MHSIWRARALLAVLGPLVALLVLEGTCRLFQLGYPTSFLLAGEQEGKPVWQTNPFYGYRFFDPLVARLPAPLAFEQQKPEGVTRVAVLGESAARGDPVLEFSVARALDKVLNEPGAERRFELLDASMTAISSPIIVDIAEELARKEVDIFVLYMGNNEVIGPYGPDSVFTRSGWGNRWTAWRVRLTRLRLASAYQAWLAQFAEDRVWQGMAMFDTQRLLPDDERVRDTHRRFEANVRRILALADRHDIQVILCTVAVNLKDCPPFASAGGEAESMYEEALSAWGRGETNRAAALFRSARDADALRVRTDGAQNESIRSLAGENGRARLVDIEEAFGPAPGADLFWDHVHFTIDGLHLLATEIAGTIREHTGKEGDRSLSRDALAERMFFTPASEWKQASVMRQRRAQPPFIGQLHNERYVAGLDEKLRSLSSTLQAMAWDDVARQITQCRQDYPHDREYAVQWIEMCMGIGEWQRARDAFEQDVLPHVHGYTATHNMGATIYAMLGDAEAAADLLLSAGPPYGYTLLSALFTLSETLENEGREDALRAILEQMLAKGGTFPGRQRVEQAAYRYGLR